MNPYQGELLHIAVVGYSPKIREKSLINFTIINLEELTEKRITEFGAVFITRNYLKRAAEPEYAGIYRNSSLPFFFIESEKQRFAFTHEQISYEDAHPLSNPVMRSVIRRKHPAAKNGWSGTLDCITMS